MKFTSEDLLKAMGLKVGDEIKTKDDEFKIVNEKLLEHYEEQIFCKGKKRQFLLQYLIDEEYEIIQPKPTLTEDEKVILRNLPKEFKWIVRDDKMLIISTHKPLKENVLEDFGKAFIMPYYNLFQFIEWEDKPYSIEELLGESK